ncbi:Uncharacterized conserved protein [Desulfuromusa kysingii]|uniref:Uncharacterized conserved protein n=1 Tax=Desulfuromusa kysingii TaxID=37625 RepID=A0A1H3VPG2_9BACT|nr:6-hydroxymethylpterin diphosphokinase MptE-like protein [Desulfuromusa kysingii]SDZ76008.1 Uncharacterized conserved protein [Desulfuromusa kysingii]
MTAIEQLKKLTPQQRADSLERLYQKNKRFFKEHYPAVAELLRPGGIAPFHINVTDDFLSITNSNTGELCHPEVGLDRFAETLGDWTHSAWIDLIEGRAQGYSDQGKYSQFPVFFQKSILSRFPGLGNRMNHRLINLPTLPSGKRFSNSVIFMGVYHGLHIDYYLSRTQLQNALFIEPDHARFNLSCYFLDFKKLKERFGELLLHVGQELPEMSLELFFQKSKVSGAVWTRILPAYPSDIMDVFVQKIRLRWRQAYDVWHPADWQLDGVSHAMENIHAGERILSNPHPLDVGSRIAVVGAGPSLSDNLDWLKQNQEQFIIFAVHSAVSALRGAGISPDFQFTLDINPWPESHFERLQLDPSVPVVNTVNDIPGKFSSFDDVLMLPEDGGINPVQFNHKVPFLTPTSGNMALAFACWCKPSQIYLFGLDFAFKEAGKTHVAESSVYQTETEHRAVLFSGHLPVASNFDGSHVVTQSYFNLARLCAQRPIAYVAQQVEVFNCSDGARIDGAVPAFTCDVELKPYCKINDVKIIQSMFVPLEKDIHWQPHLLDGDALLNEYKKVMLRELKMTKFNWGKFSRKIDTFRSSLLQSLPKKISQNSDRRMEPYLQVVELLLNSWYRFLCFTNDAQEWQQVYDEGYKLFSALIDEMVWPKKV